MIAAGEAGGILDTILKRLATYIEKAVKLKGQVKSAMIYPVAIVVIAGVVVGVILWKVIPTFASLFAGLGADLPLPTRVVIALSDNLVRFVPFLIVGAGAFGYALQELLRDAERAAGRSTRSCSRCRSSATSCARSPSRDSAARCRRCSRRACRFSTALDITAKTAGNAIIEDAIMSTRTSIERGETIAPPLKETAVFPPMVVQMIGVGEATGALDTMLAQDRRLLRGRSRRRGRRPADAARTDHDRAPRRHRRRHRHRDVHADLRSDQQADEDAE